MLKKLTCLHMRTKNRGSLWYINRKLKKKKNYDHVDKNIILLLLSCGKRSRANFSDTIVF